MNNKSKLNTYCQKSHKPVPCYSSEKKGDVFVSTVILDEASYDSINGHSTKKEAENDAAGVAIQAIVQIHSANKSIDELIEGLPASKNKKKPKQQKPDTQQPEQLGPEFTPVSAVNQTPINPANSYRILQPRPQQPLSNADPRVLNRSFPLPGQPTQIPPQIPPQVHQPLTGTAFGPYVPQQPFPQPSPHRLYYGQVPGMHPVRQPTMPARMPVSLPGTPMYIQPPPGYAMSPTAAYVHAQPNLGKPCTAIPSLIRSPPPSPVSSSSSVQPLPHVTSNTPSENAHVNAIKTEDRGLYEILENYCKKYGLPDPIYSVKEKSGKYSAKVEVGNVTFCTEQDFYSFVTAKENVTLKALATVGMQALSLGSPRLSTPASSRATSSTKTPDSLTDVSSDLHVSPHHSDQLTTEPSYVKLSQERITTALDSGNKPLKPPSFFQQSTEGSPSHTLPHTSQNPPTCIPGPDNLATSPHIVSKGMEGNHKATLNTYCQKNRLDLSYDCTYPEDEVGYIATVSVGGMKFTSIPHGTKRAAEAHAAEQAVQYLGAYREMNRSAHPTHHPVSVSVPVTQLAAPSSIASFKNLLQEYCQKSKMSLPHYETERTDEGFKSTVRVHPTFDTTMEYTSSAQPAKKAAEQEAAKLACEGLNIV